MIKDEFVQQLLIRFLGRFQKMWQDLIAASIEVIYNIWLYIIGWIKYE